MNERKEIIQISGTTLLFACIVLANLLFVGLVYRWYRFEEYQIRRDFNDQYAILQNKVTMIHKDIVELEKVSSWMETEYAKQRSSVFESGRPL